MALDVDESAISSYFVFFTAKLLKLFDYFMIKKPHTDLLLPDIHVQKPFTILNRKYKTKASLKGNVLNKWGDIHSIEDR